MPTEKPNVVLIPADDAGWLDVGSYHRGLMGTRTANIDQFASELAGARHGEAQHHAMRVG